MPEPEGEARRPTSVEQQERLESLGYSAELVKRARNRSGGDTNLASELLLTNRLPDDREEFEIVAEATDPDGKSGAAKRSTDRAEKAQSGDEANHRSGAIESAPASAVLETPISTLVGCGFGAAEAEAALKASLNDVEAAVTALLERKRCEAAEFGPSPHDVLAEADDPYRRDAKKRPEPVPNNPDKGHFRDGLGPNPDPGEILDNRLAHLRDMGFNVRDAEAALKAAHNNVDQALSLLLNLHGSGSYFNESPHDVLVRFTRALLRRKSSRRPMPRIPTAAMPRSVLMRCLTMSTRGISGTTCQLTLPQASSSTPGFTPLPRWAFRSKRPSRPCKRPAMMLTWLCRSCLGNQLPHKS